MLPVCCCTLHYVQEGASALYCATQEGHTDVVKALVEAKANLNQQTEASTLPDQSHLLILANSV